MPCMLPPFQVSRLSCLARAQLGFGQRGPKSLCRTGWRGLAQWESMCLRPSPLFAPDQSFPSPAGSLCCCLYQPRNWQIQRFRLGHVMHLKVLRSSGWIYPMMQARCNSSTTSWPWRLLKSSMAVSFWGERRPLKDKQRDGWNLFQEHVRKRNSPEQQSLWAYSQSHPRVCHRK